MIGRITPFHCSYVTWSWLKPMPTGGRKVKDWWEEEPYKVECQIEEGIPSYLMKIQQTRYSRVSTKINFFSLL